MATLLVDGVVTRFDNSDATYTEGDNANLVYTDNLDDAYSRLSSFTAGGGNQVAADGGDMGGMEPPPGDGPMAPRG